MSSPYIGRFPNAIVFVVVAQWMATSALADALVHKCEAVYQKAEVYADPEHEVQITQQHEDQHCLFMVGEPGSRKSVSCDAVDILAEIQAPKPIFDTAI